MELVREEEMALERERERERLTFADLKNSKN